MKQPLYEIGQRFKNKAADNLSRLFLELIVTCFLVVSDANRYIKSCAESQQYSCLHSSHFWESQKSCELRARSPEELQMRKLRSH